MKFVNKKNLPAIIVNAVIQVNEKYSRGDADISTTQLIDAPLQRVLKMAHADDITIDVSDMLWSFFGTLGHEILANIESDDVIWKERRFYADVNGYKISGQPDIYYKDYNGVFTLSDFKVTAKYSFKEGPKPEYVNQLNIYRWFCQNNGFMVDNHTNIVIFRDALSHEDKVMVYPVVRYTMDKVYEYICKRVRLHQAATEAKEGELVCCTKRERWEDPVSYYVLKEGNKKQTGGNYASLNDAELFCGELRQKHPKNVYEVKEKRSKPTRCLKFCTVSEWCPYYEDLTKDFM